VKIFNWIGTLWGGSIRLKTPMLFAIGFVAMFIIGGLSGVTHAVVPSDRQQTDTYYIVAHFHYVLFGGALFGLFGGLYYWWPKMFGRKLSEGLGKTHFWLMFLGFNLTFAPFHILGLQGMPRRIYTYPDGMGWNIWNFVSTIGAFTIALSILVFIVAALKSRKGEEAEGDPWDARTIEWSMQSPPPEHNFDEIPVIKHRDDFWYRKYLTDPEGEEVRVFAGGADAEHDEDGGHGHIHMPDPSYWPLLAAVGPPIMGYGVIYSHWGVLIGGGVLTILSLFGWGLEPSAEEDH